MRVTGFVCCLFYFAVCLQAAPKPLQIFAVDVEGGQATLFVTPSGQSLLIDTGWPGYNYRDAIRIADAAKKAKIKKLDYVLITHFHTDHAGGVPQLADKMPIGKIIDHGENREDSRAAKRLSADYEKAISDHSIERMTVKPGDKIPIKGLDVTIVSADGKVLQEALPDAGKPNPFCDTAEKFSPDQTENARSVGTVLMFGKLKIVDLGDLTSDKELELMCPNNKIGRAGIFIVSHHGLYQSNSMPFVHAIAPRVAIMDNGAKKGGSPQAWDIIKSSPGLEALWQLHFSDEGGKAHNVDDAFIANVDEGDTGHFLKVTAHEDGSFEVFNPRNKQQKDYAAR